MKTLILLAAASVISLTDAGAASVPETGPTAFGIFPKNLARQHLGTNVFLYREGNQTFVPTEAGAAWLDDDVATGWPTATGRQYYMLTLSQAELITRFALSTRGSTGTVTIYAGDEAAPPTAKSWVVLARDLPVEALNEKISAQGFSRFAKYILIETNLTASGPCYGIYLYGEKPATDFSLEKRAQPLNAQGIFRFVNDLTSISLSSLYAKARVSYVNSDDNSVAVQKAIDDNPETSTTLVSSESESGMIVQFHGSQNIQRISALTDVGAKGRLDFYL
ncbi:MAG: hypothetical protein H7Y36_02435, partial [Armatimonadetes bacterium]|nr:hypothetical protein [Akkermansiaceae bacterium]